MKDYEDFIGTLEKISQRIFSRGIVILTLKNDCKRIFVEFGEEGSRSLKIGETYTIGHVGKKLINIREGIRSEFV